MAKNKNSIAPIINEDEAELLIEEHLRNQGWNLTDFETTRKRWRKHLNGEEADRVFFYQGKLVAILEAKKLGKDLWAALDQAKNYARTYQKNTVLEIPFLEMLTTDNCRDVAGNVST